MPHLRPSAPASRRRTLCPANSGYSTACTSVGPCPRPPCAASLARLRPRAAWLAWCAWDWWSATSACACRSRRPSASPLPCPRRTVNCRPTCSSAPPSSERFGSTSAAPMNQYRWLGHCARSRLPNQRCRAWSRAAWRGSRNAGRPRTSWMARTTCCRTARPPSQRRGRSLRLRWKPTRRKRWWSRARRPIAGRSTPPPLVAWRRGSFRPLSWRPTRPRPPNWPNGWPRG